MHVHYDISHGTDFYAVDMLASRPVAKAREPFEKMDVMKKRQTF